MTEDGLNNNIDSILKLFDKDIEVGENQIRETHADNTPILIEKMISFGIITTNTVDRGFRILTLDQFGHEVRRHGSWTRYLADKEEEKKANRQLVSTSIKTNYLQKWLLWLTAGFTFLTFCVAIADYFVHREELNISKKALNNATTQREDSQTDFEKYLSTLPQINLPTNLELNSDGSRYEYGEFAKFKTRWSDKPFGKLYETGNLVVTVDLIIASSLAPVFVIYDKQGKIIDALVAFKKSELEETYETVESVYVDEKQIKVFAETTNWRLTKDKTRKVPGSETITRDTVTYTIDGQGKFKKAD